jgi:hypothetical protein
MSEQLLSGITSTYFFIIGQMSNGGDMMQPHLKEPHEEKDCGEASFSGVV